MKPLVSIIIPLYNAERYIETTIRSAMAQTWTNKEIIVVNDGSTDRSLSLAKAFENGSIRVFSQINKGASAARNYGLREAKGEYVQFLDADDLLSPDKITAQMELLLQHEGHLGLCATVHFLDATEPEFDEAIHEWYAAGSADTADLLIKLYGGDLLGPQYGGMITIHSWLTPRKILDQAGPWDEQIGKDDDGEFFCRVVLAAKGITYSKNGTAYYRKYLDHHNLSSQTDHKGCSSALRSTLSKADHLLAATNNPKAKQAMARLFWDNAFLAYPKYKDVYKSAEEEARVLDPAYHFQPYKQGIKKILADTFGWKLVRSIQFLNSRIS